MFKRSVFGALAFAALCLPARGQPLVPPVIGPKLICFRYSTFRLEDGERVTDISGSMEGISLTVESRSGGYDIGESEIFATVNGRRQLVSSHGHTRVYRVSGHERSYAIYEPNSPAWGNQPLIWLTGAALRNTARDRGIFSRFEVRDPRSVRCEQTYTYGGISN